MINSLFWNRIASVWISVKSKDDSKRNSELIDRLMENALPRRQKEKSIMDILDEETIYEN